MNADTILYLCIYVCACVVAFDLIFAFYLLRMDRIMPGRKSEVTTLIKDIAEDHINGEAARREKHISDYKKKPDRHEHVERYRKSRKGNPMTRKRRLMNKLREESYLLAYIAIADAIRKDDPELYTDFLRAFIGELAELADEYSRKADEYKALMAYALYITDSGNTLTFKHAYKRSVYSMAESLMPNMMNKSAYVRQNTFRALVKMGDVKSVMTAVTILDSDVALQNEKLMTDDLLLFSGDTDELLRQLWDCFMQLTPSMQVMAINYFRLLPLSTDQSAFYETIRQFITDESRDPETRIAAMRYFRRRVYGSAKKDLIAMLEHRETEDYEYPAIAAASLQSYPGKDTERILMDKLSDPNWYTRFNCAESLIALGVDYEKLILESTDRYAKDMLIYRSEVYELKKRRSA